MANVVTEIFQSGVRLFRGETFTNAFQKVNNAFGGTSRSVNGVATYTQISPLLTTADGLTATPSGTQTTSLLLTAVISRVSTVATAADGVRLPPSVAGMQLTVVNGAASNAMQVFGTNPDTINDVATATGVSQAAGKSAIYTCTVAGKWYRNLSA